MTRAYIQLLKHFTKPKYTLSFCINSIYYLWEKAVAESESDTEEYTECLYWQGLHQESNSVWITCQMCGKMAYWNCAGIQDDVYESTSTTPVWKDGSFAFFLFFYNENISIFYCLKLEKRKTGYTLIKVYI